MKTLSLHDNTVHLWRVWLNDFSAEVQNLSDLLSADEVERANRFHFEIHRERFVIARAFLRKILQLYTGIPPKTFTFYYGPHGKPSIDHAIQFNLSHSEELAVYAITMHKEIGVDVEKITEHFKEGVAKRFFNASEYAQLLALPEHERPRMFYHFWARKEALQKSIGNGLFENTDNHAQYDIESFFVHADYEAAFAITPPLLTVEQWEWRPKNYVKLS